MWRVGDAKQRLSEVLRLAQKKPQVIYNRERAVAAVISAETFARFTEWEQQERSSTLADSIAEAAQICREEGYTLEPPKRVDRVAADLPEKKTRAPRRHQRRQ